MRNDTSDSGKSGTSTPAMQAESFATMPASVNPESPPEASITQTEAVTAVVGVAAAIAYACTGPLAVGIALSYTLLGIAIPFLLEKYKLVSKTQATDIFQVITERSIADAIDDANTQMNGLKHSYDIIGRTFNTWQNTTNDQERNNAKTQLRTAYINVTQNGRGQIISAFTSERYGGFKLNEFAFVSSRYLAALKDFHRYAEELELPAINPGRNIKEWTLTQLQIEIGAIMDLAETSYRRVTTQFFNQSTGYQRTWDEFNNYRNTTTLTALDAIAAFPYLDLKMYPAGCHARNLNRRLIKFLSTSPDNTLPAKYRSNIQEVEQRLRLDMPSAQLAAITAWGATFMNEYTYHVNGLTRLTSLSISTDGSGTLFKPIDSGFQLHPGWKPGQIAGFTSGPVIVLGEYEAATFDTRGKLDNSILKLTFYTLTNRTSHYVSLTLYANGAYRPKPFSLSIPDAPASDINLSDLEKLSGGLSHMKLFRANGERQFNLVTYWNHRQATEPLLPQRSHEYDTQTIQVEQFHAIRAGTSFYKNGYPLVPGNCFTGGDMVRMKSASAGQYTLKWHIEQKPPRWFSGRYRIRIWYINLYERIHCYFSLQVSPSVGASSRQSFDFWPRPTKSSLNNLQFSDLQEHTTLPSETVLITKAMTSIDLELFNYTINYEIVIDRIELIFESSASI